MDEKTLRKIADEIMQLKKGGWAFSAAGYHVLNSYGIREGASEVLSKIGSMLGKGNRGRKKLPRKNPCQSALLSGLPREVLLKDALRHEASILAGIPTDDL